jgi:AraC-like DNA-binding protein
MRPIPLIRAAGVLAFVRFLREVGTPADRHWEGAGLSPRALAEPEHLLPLHLVTRFVENGARKEGIDDLGLRIGAQSTLDVLGTFGTAIRAAGTLGRAFGTARDTVAAHNSGASYWVVYEGGSARLCRRLRDRSGVSRQIDLFTVVLITQLVRLAAGPDWTPSRIELQSAGPLALRDTGPLGDASISVGAPVTSVELPRHLLSRRIAPPALRTVPDALAAWLRSAPPRDFLSSIETLVAGLLEAESADVVTVAEGAGMTVRSLQRRLAESGSSYSALLDRVRFRTATRLIEDPDVKLITIALALGYSDAAHFTRAFRRWTSVSPLEYRRVLLGRRVDLQRSA